jgi:hypothetical protein
MPVTATPVYTGEAATTDVVLSPTITRLYDIPVPPKRRAAAITQGSCAALRIQLVNEAGDALDLSSYVPERYTVALAMGEYVASDSSQACLAIGSIESPASAGWVSVTLPALVARRPGIYLAQVAVTDDLVYPRCAEEGEVVQSITTTTEAITIRVVKLDTSTADYVYPVTASVIVGIAAVLTLKQQLVRDVCIVLNNVLYVSIEKGLLGNTCNSVGPPSLAEVRLELRDFPEVNRLLDEYEFDAAEVLLAATRCVEYFNEVPPELDQRYDTSSFPSRYHWMEGTIYHLLRIAIAWYDRNKLAYSAGGVQVDDLNRSEAYLRHLQMRQQKWEEWVKRTKNRLNAESGFLSLGSDYNSGWW